MTASPMEHPSVELSIDHVLVPASIASLTARNATADPPEAIKAAILQYRLYAIRHMKENLVTAPLINDEAIRASLETAWATFSPVFGRSVGPMIAETYIKAFRNAHKGTVPISMIYQLADEHADRMGRYFNETSADALVIGFNTYVNRKVPQKAALERVVDAYGMTPRQMSGFTSAIALQPQEVKSGVAQRIGQKIKQYIGASISQRLKIFSGQEEHNIEEQAKQVAWMWLEKEGRIPANAEKMWLTAKDERVCTTCGPLHGRKVGLRDTFRLQSGLTVYTPGAHVNCRCEIRLMVPPKLEAVKKADFDEREHRRSDDGRFTFKPATQSGSSPRTRTQRVDPALERLAAEARRMSTEERKQATKAQLDDILDLYDQVVGEEEKPKRLGVKRMRLSEGKLGAGQKLGVEQPKLLLGEPKKELGVSAARDRLIKPKLELSEEQKQTLGVQLDRLIEQSTLKAKKGKILEEHKDQVNIGKPVFGFVDYYDVDGKSYESAELGRVRIHDLNELRAYDKDRWREALLSAARDKYNENQNRAIEDIINEHPDALTGERILTRTHPKHGKLYAKLHDDQVMSAVDAVVHPTADWANAKTQSVIWQDKYGNVIFDEDDMEAQMSPKELGRLLEVDPQDLEVIIVTTDRGAEGAYQDSADMKYGFETWYAGGIYRITGESTDILSPGGYDSRNEGSIPIRILTVEPDVPPIFHAERTMTDEEADRELGFE